MTINDDWPEFWKQHGKSTMELDEQSQVHRTLKKAPVSEDIWKNTLLTLNKNIVPTSNDDLLELCSGNGLISRYFSDQVREVTAVDISPHLLDIIDKEQYKNIKTISKDIRAVKFPPNSFDIIIIYAGIQYFTYSEVTSLLDSIFGWLKSGGKLYIGDIPDVGKKWDFYSTEEYKTGYFDNLKNKNNDVIGTWFEQEFMKNLSKYIGYSSCDLIEQNAEFIYSAYRFDIILRK